jgi:type IV secretory pathway TrbD component
MNLPTPAQAGVLAAVLFTAQTWICLVCGLVLIAVSKRQSHSDAMFHTASVSSSPSGWIVTGMLCAALTEFVVSPKILAHENMALWHSLGSALYAVQWICASGYMWRLFTKIKRS